ncbi:MAG: PPK2 family polyphosphate kinase [Marinicellaceae bacterium]
MKTEFFKSTVQKPRAKQKDIESYFKESPANLKKLQKKLAKLQSKIQAEKKQAVLVIFQAMDAAGKDSTIRNVFAQCDIAGVSNVSFKQPSKEESAHDFLWRCSKKLPKKGEITLFNRSYYEEVLVVKVHPEWLSSQAINSSIDDEFWNNRYASINDFEKHLKNSGTKIIKFMLDVSQREQHNRLIRRYNTPSKQWKFSVGDIKESKFWPEYQNAFDDLLSETSKTDNPWYVIPADDKELMRMLVTEILIEELTKLNPQYPPNEKISSKDMPLVEALLKGEV